MTARAKPGQMAVRVLHRLRDGSQHRISALAQETGLTNRQVSTAASQLRLRNYLADTQAGFFKLNDAGKEAVRLNVKITCGPIAPTNVIKNRVDSLRERAWRAMRFRGQFTLNDIVGDAQKAEKDPQSNLTRYIGYLLRAGYVVRLPVNRRGTKLTSPGFKRYHLLKNTGPQAPVYRPKRSILHDFNTGEDIPCRMNP